jgi:hypothetical protein
LGRDLAFSADCLVRHVSTGLLTDAEVQKTAERGCFGLRQGAQVLGNVSGLKEKESNKNTWTRSLNLKLRGSHPMSPITSICETKGAA